MNKGELIAEVAEVTNSSKKETGVYLEAIFNTISKALCSGDKVQLIGFGNFELRKRSARKGRNPQTGAEINIPESIVPAFKPGKTLKEAVKNK